MTARLLVGRRGVVVGVSGENSIGFHVAKALQAHGAEVAVTSRPGRVPEVQALAEANGFSFEPLEATNEQSIREAFAHLGERFERLDFLVHTLVSVPSEVLARPLVELERDAFHGVLDAGVWSLVRLCREAEPWLSRSDAPRVVTLTSECGERMTPHYHVAGIGKAALGAAVLYLAYELGPKGILVNAVSPSLLATDGAMTAVGAKNAEATRAYLAKKAPTRKPVEQEDAAQAVAWLSSPSARNITGETLVVDGGYSRIYL